MPACFYTATSQKMTFSPVSKNENENIRFDIIGKFNRQILVYKYVSGDHYITQYNAEMNLVKNISIDSLPNKVFNVDFISYPNFFFMIYQYQKNNIVYCSMLKMDGNGKRLNEITLLDTTNDGFFASNKIYTITNSEDKKKILLYKRNVKNSYLTQVTKLFDNDFKLLDSTRELEYFDYRKETYGDMTIDNKGNLYFPKTTAMRAGDYADKLTVYVHTISSDTFSSYDLPLEKKYIREVGLKVDNLNSKLVVYSFFYGQRKGYIEGLYSASLAFDGPASIKTAFNYLGDSLRNKINTFDNDPFVFDNLIVRNIVLKKNGGFVISAEDFYTESYSNSPFYNSSNYYLYNPSYYGYRPGDSYGSENSTRFYYNDIVIVSIDSTSKIEWNSLIRKRQMDIDNDNFLSYSTLNAAGEIRLFYLDT